MKNKNSKGFAIFEVLFFVLLVAVIVAAAYYIGAKHNKKTGNTNNSVSTSTKSNHAVSQTPAVKTFKFTNLGVQFTLPGSLNDLQYTPQTYSDGSAGGYITTTTISNAIKQCIASQGQQAQSDDAESLAFAGISKSQGQFDSSQVIEAQLLKQFSSFYIDISYPNGNSPCYPDQNAMDNLTNQEHAADSAFESAFKSTATEIK